MFRVKIFPGPKFPLPQNISFPEIGQINSMIGVSPNWISFNTPMPKILPSDQNPFPENYPLSLQFLKSLEKVTPTCKIW